MPRDEHEADETFPALYLGTIAIIQGVALAALAQDLFQSDVDRAFDRRFMHDVLPYVVATFGIILLVAFEYNSFAVDYGYELEWYDTVIPYLLGAAEIVCAMSVYQPDQWWIAVSLFSVVGIVAYCYTLSRSRFLQAYVAQNSSMIRMTVRRKRSFAAIGAVSAVYASFVANDSFKEPGPALPLPALAVCYSFVLIFIFVLEERVTSANRKLVRAGRQKKGRP